MNINNEPPIKAFNYLGTKNSKHFLSRRFSLFCLKFCVYDVMKSAPIVKTLVRGVNSIRNMSWSLTYKKKRPRVISLATHPSVTLMKLFSLQSYLFSLRKTKVRLLRGPILKLAIMKPAQTLKKAVVAPKKRSPENMMKRGLLPNTSDATPVMKLPRAYDPKV